MRKIDKLILKSFLGPLLLTFAIAVFVLLMQFVWKYIDDLVGKGLEFRIIAELLFYASATFVPMALPISVLFASIMTMGNFGEKYELVAMKAGGISLRRVMMPMTFVALLLTGVGFYFANNVMPAAMLKYRTILYDVTRKKPAINIRPSEYYTEIDGYVIRVDGKDADGMTLRDVTIFDNTKGSGQSNIIVAKSGRMQTSADERYMIFTLYDGCYYSEAMEGNSYLSRPLTRVNFAEEVMTFDISSFAFNKSDDESFQGTYQMMNVSQLDEAASGLEKYRDGLYDEFGRQVDMRLKGLTDGRTRTAPTDGVGDQRWLPAKGIASAPEEDRRWILDYARGEAVQALDEIKRYNDIIESENAYINRHYIELHRKFTLSVACLLLFLVGAPFGSIVRKGGLGLPLVASVGFFVFYYVIGMICEKAVRESAMSPAGMWVSSLVMLPIGVFLTVQATTDRDLALGQWFGLAGERLKVRWRWLRLRWRRRCAKSAG
ncbi:MAG: LptF/LptG family permease [Bacteroidales bacterium]|nr:LptF/LptG family permease [Bacteroidales bacterium]